LQDAGRVVAVGGDGTVVAVNRGALESTWKANTNPPLAEPVHNVIDQPTSMAQVDEAMLLWKWLSADGVELVETTGALTFPAHHIAPVAIGGHGRRQATEVPGRTGSSGRSKTTPRSVIAPMTRTSDRKPPTRIGSKPVTAITWDPTRSSGR
jgi:hypothetical protein